MSPGGAGNYYIKLGISINGDAQLQRVLDNIKALRTEVTGLAEPLNAAAAESRELALQMTAIATGARAATAAISFAVHRL